MTYAYLELEQEASLAVVTLNRPAVLNVLHSPMRKELIAVLHRLKAETQVSAVMFTGAGDKAFCAGQDLEEAVSFDAAQAEAWMDETVSLFEAIYQLAKPCVAAINGVAAGVGFQLALLCDLRVGCVGTRMGQPELNAGIPSILGPSLMLATVGYSRTVELALTGRLIDAEESLQLGLLHYVVADVGQLKTKARFVALELAAQPPLAMQLTRKHLHYLAGLDFAGLRAVAQATQRQAFASGEPQAVIRAFLEVRRQRRMANG